MCLSLEADREKGRTRGHGVLGRKRRCDRALHPEKSLYELLLVHTGAEMGRGCFVSFK